MQLRWRRAHHTPHTNSKASSPVKVYVVGSRVTTKSRPFTSFSSMATTALGGVMRCTTAAPDVALALALQNVEA